jgi:Right handed beta helix region
MKYLFPGGIGIDVLSIRRHLKGNYKWLLVIGALIAGICQSARAATLCVNPGGTLGCYSTIGAAVANARMDYLDNGTIDIIQVAPGVYTEDVQIETPLSLIGAGRGRSIINALGLANGIYIDGIDSPKPRLSKVVVTGFTVENANFEGILVTNASFVTVWDNEVINNDRSLPGGCPGLPGFETAEGFDCGEGIHLSGVDHSTVGHNTSAKNSGGILLSDDTGATHDNRITGNLVHDNPSDCGITLASHPPASLTGSTSPLGVFHNIIAENESFNNGLAVAGAGAGAGIFDSVPGAQAYGNVVINNQLRGNGLPGVAMHSHTPGQNLNDNLIIGNRISGNGADTADAATSGPTGINIFGVSPVTGTVIEGNLIEDEAEDIVTKTPAEVNVHFNDLLGGNIGVDNIGTGTVDATENWWGCPNGPSTVGCTNVKGNGVSFTPWLTHPVPNVSPSEDQEQGNQGDDLPNNAER